MNFEVAGDSASAISKGLLINLRLHKHCWTCIMDHHHGKTRRKTYGDGGGAAPNPMVDGRKMEYQYHRSLSQVGIGKGSGRRLLPASYFSLESLLLLICLTASLLILPLILPPLPPPPFLLLLLPIGILLVLMFLAFMPSNVRDITYTYV
ncbi:Auxin regulated protein [Parasponia andersonii]|uniref:Auxin regulated protein n=1 Tax=Parasponia andersonii TaxID=3476 RepID=A0A2P5A7E5_PARAD|nr:Auxin regulated protein [Parasponia andersonii]